MVKTIRTLKEMDAFAARFAKTLKGGETLALVGELGAGKTAFVKALAKAFGIKATVQSPTFLLMKCYPIGQKTKNQQIKTLCHVDAYRIKSDKELAAIGLEEHLHDPRAVTAIEWADLVPKIIPKRAIRIEFAHGKKGKERIIVLK